LGGTGKTALAAEYAHRRAAAYGGGGGGRAGNRALLVGGLAELAGRLGPGLTAQFQRTGAPAAPEKLEEGGVGAAGLQRLGRSAIPFLLIYDNVDQPETLRDLIPTAGARVLITTRWADWMGRAVELKLDLLDDAAAAQFLQKRAGRSDAAGAG